VDRRMRFPRPVQTLPPVCPPRRAGVRIHALRYHGLFAPNSKKRREDR
jgi:hypothetical protein